MKFSRSPTDEGYPVPLLQPREMHSLTDTELAEYIEVCGFDYDGMGSSVREALVRLLRRALGEKKGSENVRE